MRVRGFKVCGLGFRVQVCAAIFDVWKLNVEGVMIFRK